MFHICKDLFGDIQKSPYKDRIFVILDQRHGKGVIESLEGMGLPRDHVIVWSRNGIEYYYPKSVIQSIYHSDEEIQIEGDKVCANGLEYTKNELVGKVTEKLDEHSEYDQEFQDKFLAKLDVLLA